MAQLESNDSTAVNALRFIIQIEVPASVDTELIAGPDGRQYPQLSEEIFDAFAERVQDAIDEITRELLAEWPSHTAVHAVPELIDFD